MTRAFEIHGVSVPTMLYGTAWKEERTAELVRLALASGFVGIDTANQRKHYFEAAVGEAIAGAPRERLFLQSKFTDVGGQDHRLPYDPSASLTDQVEQSFASSLEHLGVAHLDAYVLHGPHTSRGWTDADREVWRAMEALHDAGHVRLLGVSNISHAQLRTLLDEARVAPALVQNRCYARTGWDREVRALCSERGLLYQGFSLLTANRTALARPTVAAIARRVGATVPQVVFRFAEAIGMIALTGTSDPAHMREDLAAYTIALTPADVAALEALR